MLIIRGQKVELPGRVGRSFVDDDRLRLTSYRDFRPRREGEVVRAIVLHTRWGVEPRVLPGVGPNHRWDELLAGRFSADERSASCHVAIDADGSYGCFADLATTATYHGNHLCGSTVGLELYQERDGTMWQSTLVAAADVCDLMTRAFGIQRQFPIEHDICPRLASGNPGRRHEFIDGAGDGRDFVGLVGHRNITRNRGPGDPGAPIWQLLQARGYEAFELRTNQDQAVWRERQQSLGVLMDGIPGPVTRGAIRAWRGGGPGLWVERPGDRETLVA